MELKLLDDEIVVQFNTKIKYIMLECGKCGHSWGVMINDSQSLKAKDIVCRDCAANEKLCNLKK